ncbi:nad dependent epimerase dehydratase family protein [Colletotrichum karsti]|uniref:Nad dependent epimerase dehydratase family protein n=1 Tax=Colletotrichum karsti TaxID=1095194 RepID=A0A9P6I1W3_9PEZI|nr:nad dependent epimerase dehydratase family protein [Colletotrichum karsti]KAF9874714.1 nad dependent epimerase dehydratase family protein [Colletotrichum karsti]
MSSSLIFITGATGFIGGHVVAATLKAGHRVRLSVRREEQIQKLKTIFAAHASQLDFIVIPDFRTAEAFVDAVIGVDYIIHVASPMVGKGVDFKKDYIAPAVQGTLSVLDAVKTSPTIKRVEIMSSLFALAPIGALSGQQTAPLVLKEHSENKLHVDPDMAVPEGVPGHGLMYQGSKILAHQATADWVAKNKPSFPVLTFHPSFVTGPSLSQTKPEEIDSINHLVLETIRTGAVTIPPVFVDVRDVAHAMAEALSAPVPAFQEFILSGHATTWSEVAELAQKLYPTAGFKLKAPVQEPPAVTAVTKAADEILGMKWKSLEEVIRGVVDVQLALAA